MLGQWNTVHPFGALIKNLIEPIDTFENAQCTFKRQLYRLCYLAAVS